jgi:hypothetical protein
MTQTKVREFELCDFGIDHCQYFQGIGTSLSSFTEATYGVGDNPREALDDCLEIVAQQGFDTEDLERRICEEMGWKTLDDCPTTPSVSDDEELADDDCCEVYYHFGIRWN